MKSYVLMILLLLGCLGTHAQTGDGKLVSLCKTNLEGLTEYNNWAQFSGSQGEYSFFSIAVEPEGLAITNPRVQGEAWHAQVMVVPDGSFDLEEGHDYIVRLTVKVPSDGAYQLNMGSWTFNDVSLVSVKANDGFQIIDVEFPEYKGNVTGAHILFQVGLVKGTTVLKEVEVFEIVSDGSAAVNASKAAKAGDVMYNLAGQRVDASYKGIAIRNGQKVVK